MANYKDKFIVINRKHLKKVPAFVLSNFLEAMNRLEQFIPTKAYYVCNQDEPYAEKVIKIILAGEDLKED